MIADLVTAAVLSFSAQGEASCADAARQAAALADSQGYDAVVEAFEMRGDCVTDAAFRSGQAEAAWHALDFERAGRFAAEAIELRADAGCGRTRDTARLAFIAGLSLQVEGETSLSRYHHWVAIRVDEEVGGLSAEARELAEEYSDRIGTTSDEHRHMMNGSFLHPLADASPSCATLPQVRLRGGNPPDDRLLTLVELRTNGAGRASRVVELFSYPRDAPEELLQALRGRYPMDVRGRYRTVLDLDPCADRLSPHDREPVCLPGYTEAATESD